MAEALLPLDSRILEVISQAGGRLTRRELEIALPDVLLSTLQQRLAVLVRGCYLAGQKCGCAGTYGRITVKRGTA